MKIIAAILILAGACFAQAPASIKVCWTPEGGTETCHTVQAGEVAIVTVDGRSNPIQGVVVQPMPAYVLSAMQSHVDAQIYNVQKPDGTLERKARYSSVQDLLVQNMIKRLIVPALQLYPPTGEDAGKTSPEPVTVDLRAVEVWAPIFPTPPTPLP